MLRSTISALPNASQLSTTDKFVVDQTDATRNITVAQMNQLYANKSEMETKLEEVNAQMEAIANYNLNVCQFGAKGDGVTDDTQSIQNTFNKAKELFGNGIIPTIYFPNGNYKISNSIIISSCSFSLKMDGWLYFNKSVKYGFVFDRCTNLDLDVKVKGNSMVTNDFVYSTDWSSDVDGLCVGLRLLGCQSVKLNSQFNKFYGRGIECEGSWQLDFGHSTGQVGQFIFIKRTSGQGLLNSGIGNLGSIHVHEVSGSYFNATDINITYYENYISKSSQAKGVVFDTCNSIWITNISLGYFGNDYILNLRNCNSFNFAHAYVYGQYSNGVDDADSGDGLYIEKCHTGQINLMSSGCKKALVVNGLISTIINWSDTLSRDLGEINSIPDYAVKGVTLNITSKSRLGRGLDITDNSSGANIIDGLTINANMVDRNGISTDIYDLHINNSTSIIYLNGKISNAEIPTTNKCVINCKYDTLTNNALLDLGTSVKNDIPTINLSGYNLAGGLSNKVTKLGNIVNGSFAIEHPTQTGQLSRDSQLVTIPIKYAPSKTTSITLNILTGTDQWISRPGFINTDGRIQLVGVGIFTDNIRWVASNFSYVI